MKKLLLIDGNSLVNKNYHGSKPVRGDEPDEEYFKKIMHSSKGVYTNAVVVTLKMIFNLISNITPDYIGVAFDKSRNTFRKELYSGYKGNRPKTEAPLKEQINTTKKILSDIGIATFDSDTFEADDLIASLVNQYSGDVDETILVTTDHDYYQLVDNDKNIVIYQPKNSIDQTEKWYRKWNFSQEETEKYPLKMVPVSEEVVEDEMGVAPYLIPDIKGIQGDSSDNYPGVKGVAKAAAPLLNFYGSMEGIYQALHKDEEAFKAICKCLQISRNPIKALLAGEESAYLCKKLATMVTPEINAEILDCLPDSLSELETFVDEKKIYEAIGEYEMDSLKSYVDMLIAADICRFREDADNDTETVVADNMTFESAKLPKNETKPMLNVAVLTDGDYNNAENLDELYLLIRKITSNRKCRIFCNKRIGSINPEKFITRDFLQAEGERAIILVSKNLSQNVYKTTVAFAKQYKCQLRIIDSQKENIRIMAS